MLSDEIKKVAIEYKEFVGADFGSDNAIKYIYNNVIYDYDIKNQNVKNELLNFIKSLFNNQIENTNTNNPDTTFDVEEYWNKHRRLMQELEKCPGEKTNRIIIAGGVEFDNYDLLEKTIDEILISENIIVPEIISGHAKGTDTLGEKYAEKHNLGCTIFPANWEQYGRAAGPIRNKKMLDYAMKEKPMLIAFWNGTSKGTKNMISIAKKANVKTITYNYLTNEYVKN